MSNSRHAAVYPMQRMAPASQPWDPRTAGRSPGSYVAPAASQSWPAGSDFEPADPAADAAVRIAWADLRSQVVARLRWMNTHHAQHAWDQRVRDPLAAHALAFFAYEPAAGRFELRTATRLFLHGDAPYVLPRLVHEFTGQAIRCQQRRQDPMVTLTDRRDPLSPQARFLGVGVSSLDTRWQSWEVTQRTAAGIVDIPGRCVAVLNDGTTMVIDRGGRKQYDRFTVASTAELEVDPGIVGWFRGFDWRRVPDVAALLGGPLSEVDRRDLGDALSLLANLARVLGADRP
ncbi:hypothetical protein GCM10022255_087010 [Dactylosporangium darangshiense]|uniref:Uncharacterized protein n=1 Tax=Dactylosporangium darangshiense TaxID=579108 RepID=A0ABP8DMY9_9ACTN